MRTIGLIASLILTVIATSVRADTPGIAGDWIVDYGGSVRQTLSFRSDGNYTYKVWNVMGKKPRLIQEQNGRYIVTSNAVALYPDTGGASYFIWKIAAGSHLVVTTPAGNETRLRALYSRSAPQEPAERLNCNDCTDAFFCCNSALKSQLLCDQQYETCKATCR
jgi:hypothetical protein